jgi:ABC-type sugar transport system ATPase subunit
VASVDFRNLDKSFGAVAALRDVTFSIAGGEAHAIVGENGAGKSTLLKILAGSLRPDRGELRIDGTQTLLSGPRDALARGIGLVHQDMLAFPNLSVTANIFAGREITSRFGRLRETEMRERAAELLARLHLPVSPDAPVARLPLAHRQLLQVARALAFDCRTLALDEPTTALTAAETDHLFRILDDLKRDGVTLIYVSHRLPEVFRAAIGLPRCATAAMSRPSIAPPPRPTRSCRRWSVVRCSRAPKRSGRSSLASRSCASTR